MMPAGSQFPNLSILWPDTAILKGFRKPIDSMGKKKTERKRRDSGKHKGVIMPVPSTSMALPVCESLAGS